MREKTRPSPCVHGQRRHIPTRCLLPRPRFLRRRNRPQSRSLCCPAWRMPRGRRLEFHARDEVASGCFWWWRIRPSAAAVDTMVRSGHPLLPSAGSGLSPPLMIWRLRHAKGQAVTPNPRRHDAHSPSQRKE